MVVRVQHQFWERFQTPQAAADHQMVEEVATTDHQMVEEVATTDHPIHVKTLKSMIRL
jgi:hypothetical protein